MAEAASAENASIRPPNYRAAVQRIRTIPAKKEKVASANGDIANIWAKVEGHHVDKTAGKMFLKLDALEHPDRLRFMRDLNGLIDAAGWPEEDADMVDQAEGKVVQMRAGKKSAEPQSVEEPDVDGGQSTDEDDEEETDPPAPVERLDGMAAMQAARDRFANGGKRPELTPAYYQEDKPVGAHPDV